jgi:hypothetical protein
MSSLDNYLDRLGRELQASPEEAGEVLREIRSHLELAVLDMGRRGNNAAFTLRHFLFSTLPYAVFNGLPFLLFFVLTSLPAILALVQASARHRPPSRPVWGG